MSEPLVTGALAAADRWADRRDARKNLTQLEEDANIVIALFLNALREAGFPEATATRVDSPEDA